MLGAGNTIITVVVFNHGLRKRCNKHGAIKDDLFNQVAPKTPRDRTKRAVWQQRVQTVGSRLLGSVRVRDTVPHAARLESQVRFRAFCVT